MITSEEAQLAGKGFETRESRRMDKLKLDQMIPPTVKEVVKGYDPKGILKAMGEHEIGIQVLMTEKQKLEDQADTAFNSNDKQNPEKPHVHEANRLFIRNFDEGKLYTNRYVRRLKAAHKKLIDKFTLGSKYALVAQKKLVMARARRLVVDSHDKLLKTFQDEALTLLFQNRSDREELTLRNIQVEKLIKANRALELELSLILKQNDYLEERIPKLYKQFKNYSLTIEELCVSLVCIVRNFNKFYPKSLI